MKRRRVLLASLAVGCSCCGLAVSSERIAQVPPSVSPAEGRHFALATIEGAPELLERAASGPDPAPRLALVQLYREHGFASAACFFSLSAATPGSRTLDGECADSGTQWLLEDRDAARSLSISLNEVTALLGRQRYDAAVRFSREELARGPSLFLAAEWAYAFLMRTLLDQKHEPTDWASLDLAARVLTTGLQDARMPKSTAFRSRAAGYADLSSLFGAVGDRISSTTAAHLAIRAARVDPNSTDARHVEERMLKKLAAYEATP